MCMCFLVHVRIWTVFWCEISPSIFQRLSPQSALESRILGSYEREELPFFFWACLYTSQAKNLCIPFIEAFWKLWHRNVRSIHRLSKNSISLHAFLCVSCTNWIILPRKWWSPLTISILHLRNCETDWKFSLLRMITHPTFTLSSNRAVRPPLWSSGQSFWLEIQRSWVRFPALPDFLRSKGSGKESTQPREDNWWASWKEK
jgi:hypothetical protein